MAVALSRYGSLFAKERNHTLPAAVYHVHEAPCAVFHTENSVTKPLGSTIMLHSYGTAACLLVNVNASSNAQYHCPYSYTPLPPLSSSIPICTGDSGNSCFALLLPPASSFSRVALPPVSLVLLLVRVSVQCSEYNTQASSKLTLLPPCCWRTARPTGPFCGWCGSSRRRLVLMLRC